MLRVHTKQQNRIHRYLYIWFFCTYGMRIFGTWFRHSRTVASTSIRDRLGFYAEITLGQCTLSELHTFCILFFTLSCLLCILLYSSYWIFKSTWLNKQAIIGSCTFTKGQWCGSTFILFWDPFSWLGSGSFQNKSNF